MLRSVVLACILVLIAASSGSAQGTTGQFGDYTAPPFPDDYTYDDVSGEWINLETQLVEPILFVDSVGGQDLVCVCNEPDQRVVFFDEDLNLVGETVVGQGPASLARNPGTDELWVSVRHQMSVVVIDLVTLQVTHVLRPPISVNDVGPGAAANPGGLAFCNGEAFVAASFADSVVVYNAATKVWDRTIPLEAIHNSKRVLMNEPFGVVEAGGKVYVSSLLSGNDTVPRIRNDIDLANLPAGLGLDDVLGPQNVHIHDLGNDPDRSLPDFDLFEIDPANNDALTPVHAVGTILLGLAKDPANNRLLVTNLHARNGEFVGEAAFPEGRVALNQITEVDLSTLLASGPVSLEDAGVAGDEHVVMPTDIEILPNGNVYIAGYSSSNVGVYDANLAYIGQIDVGAGPRGLTYAAAHNRLYCYNRASASVSRVDLTSPAPAGTHPSVDLPDPTYEQVREGRIEFLKPNSGAGTANCASCHIDGRKDGLGWNLSRTLSETPTGSSPDFRDHKGVMITQDLRGIAGLAPYHWRGEQKDLEDFDGAFVELLHGNKIESQMAVLKAYVFSLEYPPNPLQSLNRVLSTEGASGASTYGIGPTMDMCLRCHSMPFGTNCDTPDSIRGDIGGGAAVETAGFRGFWTRKSALCDIDDRVNETEIAPSIGYGVLHEGVVDDLAQFNEFQGGLAAADSPNVVAFMEELDSGLAPATMYSDVLNASTAGTTRADALEEYLLEQADTGHADVAVRGHYLDAGQWVPIGLTYLRGLGLFVADDSTLGAQGDGRFSFADLEARALGGTMRLLMLGTPAGSGPRIGSDRDRDGVLDQDEIVAGLDPLDPDVDGDGLWDGYDTAPLNGNQGAPSGAPTLAGGVQVGFTNTNNIKVFWRTRDLSPTILKFGTSPNDLKYTVGTGHLPASGNHWTRVHTAYIRPIPADQPGNPAEGLVALSPDTLYYFEVVTRGQNGVESTSGLYTGSAETVNNGTTTVDTTTLIASDLEIVRDFEEAPGAFHFAVRVTFEYTQGTDDWSNLEAPAFFVHYDSSGTFTKEPLVATIQNGQAIFQWHTQSSGITVNPGDRVTFDLPMWMDHPTSGNPLVNFPSKPGIQGQWSDSKTHLDWDAGNS